MAKMAKYKYGKNGIILIWPRGQYINMANNTLYQHGKKGKISVWQKWHSINIKNWQNINMATMAPLKIQSSWHQYKQVNHDINTKRQNTNIAIMASIQIWQS